LVLRERAFRRFWLGFTFSILGDSMTRVALTWHVYETTGSPSALGWLALCYTGPVVVSGFLAASLLDRWDRRMVMTVDCLVRGLVMAAIPALHLTGHLALWHVYAAAAAWGALMMLTLAGTPALLPALVPRRHLGTANALETLSYTLVGVIGPPLAGLLAPRVGAPNLLIGDVCSYVVFAAALVAGRPAHEPTRRRPGAATGRLGDVARFLARHPVLVSTTLMFLAWNIGYGALYVWLPVVAAQRLGGGAGLYGALLGAFAAGEIGGALLAGGLALRLALGTLICSAQALSGLALMPVAVAPALATGFFGHGLLRPRPLRRGERAAHDLGANPPDADPSGGHARPSVRGPPNDHARRRPAGRSRRRLAPGPRGRAPRDPPLCDACWPPGPPRGPRPRPP
jgi:MFS family permease